MSRPRVTPHHRGPRLTAAFVLTSALASSSLVNAQQPLDDASRAAAITLGGSGLDAYDAGRYQEASEMLEKAYVVARVPTLALWSARALEKLGQWVQAAARYDEATRLELADGAPPAHRQAQQEARDELANLQARLPTLTMTIAGAPAEQVRLSFDGQPLSTTPEALKLEVNPGHHVLEAQLGSAKQVRTVTLNPGARELLVIAFDLPAADGEPAPAPASLDEPPAEGWQWPLRTWGWVSVGAGAAGFVIGTIGLAGALNKKSDIEASNECEGSNCSSAVSSLIDSYDSYKTLSTVGFVAGGLLVATGVTLILIDAPVADTQAIIGPGFVAARGTF